MAAEIEAALSIDVTLVPGGRGIFDIAVNDTVVVSKSSGGFPTEEQVVQAVRDAL